MHYKNLVAKQKITDLKFIQGAYENHFPAKPGANAATTHRRSFFFNASFNNKSEKPTMIALVMYHYELQYQRFQESLRPRLPHELRAEPKHVKR